MVVDPGGQIVAAVGAHPAVREIRLVGSRAEGQANARSDYDFLIETNDFPTLAEALPQLLVQLDPLAQQWDRLSDEMCWMVMLPGPVKVDLIFPAEPREHELPWHSANNLHAIDAHFWDWTLWLRSKEARGKAEFVAAELFKLFEHLLHPLGVEEPPSSLAEAITAYRAARDNAEQLFERTVPRKLEAEVAPSLV